MLSTKRMVEMLGGPRILRAGSLEDLRDRVRSGLPYGSLEAVTSAYAIDTKELASILHVPPRTLARRRKARRFTAEESDRLFRVGRLAALAEDVLGGREKATSWLHRPNRALGQKSPLQSLDSDLGAAEVESLLRRIEHGVYS
ncbi:MAG: antitoxin Xre/MbcA/ParS toxin-binding domain-containing protein [Acidithiobacillales bacterium]